MDTELVITGIGLAALGILAVFTASWKRGRELVAFLMGASAALTVVQVNGVHVYTFILLFYVIISRTRRQFAVAPLVMVAAALLFASTVFFGPLVRSNGPAIQLAILAISSALLFYFSRDRDLEFAKAGLLAVVSFGALIGILQTLGVVPAELFQFEGAEMHRPSSIYPEPDWYGLYSAVGVCLALTTKMPKSLIIALVGLCGIGVLLASARAAWLALLVVALWAIVRSSRPDPSAPRTGRWRGLVAAGLAGAIVALVVFPLEIERAVSRISGALAGNQGDSAVRSRLGQIDGSLTLLESAPPYGQGISAGGRVGGTGVIDYFDALDNTYSSNWVLAILLEGMLLGIPLIATLCWLALFGGRSLGGQQLLLLVLVNSLFSNAFYFPVMWFAVALAWVRTRASRRASDRLLEQFTPASDPSRVAGPPEGMVNRLGFDAASF